MVFSPLVSKRNLDIELLSARAQRDAKQLPASLWSEPRIAKIDVSIKCFARGGFKNVLLPPLEQSVSILQLPRLYNLQDSFL